MMMTHENDNNGSWCECAPGNPWLRFIAVVAFDITNGHMIEHAVKAGGDSGVPDEEIQRLRMQAMPDCNTTQLGDSFYCFRSRRKPELELGSPLEQAYDFGYALFRQEKDTHYSRGYLQKSVVIVTQLPFVALYERLVKAIGPLYFEYGYTVLEEAVSDVKQWPFPVPGSDASLAFLGYDIRFNVPEIEYPESLSEMYGCPHSHCPIQASDQLANQSSYDSALTGSDSDRLNTLVCEQKLLHVVPDGADATREEDSTQVQTDHEDGAGSEREENFDISLEIKKLPTWLTDAYSEEEEKMEVLHHGLTQNAKRRSSLPNIALNVNKDGCSEGAGFSSFTMTGSSCFFSDGTSSSEEETDEEEEKDTTTTTAPAVLDVGNKETVEVPTPSRECDNITTSVPSPKNEEADSRQNRGIQNRPHNRSITSIMADSIAGHKSCGRSPYAELLLLDETLSKTKQGLFQGIGLYSTFGARLIEKLWVLWEFVMVGEPILVVAPNVGISSAIILGMVSLVSPLYYSADFRPHFTTFDVDYPHIVSCHNDVKNMLMNKTSGRGGGGSSSQHVRSGGETSREAGAGNTSICRPVPGHHAVSSTGNATRRSEMDTKNHQPLLPVFLLGVINPIMLKTLDRWPNAIVLPGVAGRVEAYKNSVPSVSSRNGCTKSMGQRKESSNTTTGRNNSSFRNNNKLRGSSVEHHVSAFTEMRNAVGKLRTKLISHSSSLEEVVRNTDGSSAEEGHSTLFITRKPPAMHRREDIIAQLLDPYVSPPREVRNMPRYQWRDSIRAINDVILRRHFTGLTNRFLKPFQEYFTPLSVPLARLKNTRNGRDNTKRPPSSFVHGGLPSSTNLQMYIYEDAKLLMRPFKEKEFLKELKPPDGYTSVNWLSLYERFIRSPNFSPWFQMKRKACLKELSAVLKGLCLATTPDDLLQLYARFLRDSCPSLRKDMFKALEKKVVNVIMKEEISASPDLHMLQVMRGHLSAVQNVLSSPSASGIFS
eukprot:292720_1